MMLQHGQDLLLFLEWFEPIRPANTDLYYKGKPRWWDPVMRDMPLLVERRNYTQSHEVVCARHVEAVRFTVPAHGQPGRHWLVDTSGERIFDEVLELASSDSDSGGGSSSSDSDNGGGSSSSSGGCPAAGGGGCGNSSGGDSSSSSFQGDSSLSDD